MTLEEYGAWFMAFSEAMPSPPGPDYWHVIKQRVSEVDGLATTRSDYDARYRQHAPTPLTDFEFDSIPAMVTLGRAEADRIAAAREPGSGQ